MKEMPENDRPRERLEQYGAGALSTAELLAIALRTGSHRDSALSLAEKLLSRFANLAALSRASIQEMCAIEGIGPAKATQVQASLELGRRLMEQGADVRPRISSPAEAARLFSSKMQYLDQEEMHVMLLDTRNQCMRTETVYRGNVNSSMIRIAELFRPAIKDNAPQIILAHNHPSGEVTPSADDIQVTRDAVRAGELLDIAVLDHLIIGTHAFLSMKERGLGF
ncbi:MAG: DNA repair protein RadC [Chloroflexi bacterium]|nr:DNA repair protein RadC [Chloroflexota bacterium]